MEHIETLLHGWCVLVFIKVSTVLKVWLMPQTHLSWNFMSYTSPLYIKFGGYFYDITWRTSHCSIMASGFEMWKQPFCIGLCYGEHFCTCKHDFLPLHCIALELELTTIPMQSNDGKPLSHMRTGFPKSNPSAYRVRLCIFDPPQIYNECCSLGCPLFMILLSSIQDCRITKGRTRSRWKKFNPLHHLALLKAMEMFYLKILIKWNWSYLRSCITFIHSLHAF